MLRVHRLENKRDKAEVSTRTGRKFKKAKSKNDDYTEKTWKKFS